MSRTPHRALLPSTPRSLRTLTAAASLLLAGGHVLGAGFQINESSASGLGNAFAGGAAVAEDASTLWSNVAGLSRLTGRQAVGVIHLITPSIEFGNVASTAAAQQALGGNGGDAGGLNVVPNLYLAMPINASMVAGVGITAPWGLVTEYDSDWIGRFQGLRSSIRTLNINPGLSFKLSSGLALGVGLNAQRLLAEFTNQVNYSAALLGAAAANGIAPGSATYSAIAAATPGLESHARISGSDNALGWNVGLLWDLGAQHRLGLHYRSAMRYKLVGGARFEHPTPAVTGALAPTVAALAAGVNGTALFDTAIRSDVELPPIVNLSYFGPLNPRWDLMADLQWTGWSTIETLRFDRADGSLLQSTPENFKDSWKLALGANYKPSGPWMWRMGLALDRSPVQTAFRTPRLPDSHRTWLTGGVQYSPGAAWRFDFGAAYLWSRRADIRADGGDAIANGLLDGRYDSHTVIVSAQATWAF